MSAAGALLTITTRQGLLSASIVAYPCASRLYPLLQRQGRQQGGVHVCLCLCCEDHYSSTPISMHQLTHEGESARSPAW